MQQKVWSEDGNVHYKSETGEAVVDNVADAKALVRLLVCYLGVHGTETVAGPGRDVTFHKRS